jgi:hypothetical protein
MNTRGPDQRFGRSYATAMTVFAPNGLLPTREKPAPDLLVCARADPRESGAWAFVAQGAELSSSKNPNRFLAECKFFSLRFHKSSHFLGNFNANNQFITYFGCTEKEQSWLTRS